MKIEFELDEKIIKYLREKDIVSNYVEPKDDSKFILLQIMLRSVEMGIIENNQK